MKSVSLCIAGWQRQNEPSPDFSPRISQKPRLISQILHLEWLGCSGGCIYLRVPSLRFRKNFGLDGYGPPASPPLPPYQHGTPPEQQPLVSTASSLSKASKNGGFRTHFPPFELPTGALGALVLLHAQLPMRDDAARGKNPGSCPRPRPVPLHQEAGPERSSSRTRGAHLASDGSSPQLPTGAVVLLHAPLCSCPATPPRAGKSPGSCPRPRPVPLHQEPGSERSSSRTRGAHLASDGPSPQLPTGAVVLLHAPLCSCPATPPRAEKVQGAASGRPQCHCTKNQGQRGAAAAPRGRTWLPTAPTCSVHGGSRAAPRQAVRAQRRHRARNKAQGDALGAF